MQRVTITIDDELVGEIDAFMETRGYANRSEAIRDLARSGLDKFSTETAHKTSTTIIVLLRRRSTFIWIMTAVWR